MVEHLRMTTPEERRRAIQEAGYNTFLLKSEDVYIDLLTDSGTSAMSNVQWAGMMLGDEAYAGSRSFYHLEAAVRDIYRYRYVVPTHQGRGAEHILSQILIKDGDVVPGNMYFTTTRLHQELAGGTFVDVICDEAHRPTSEYPFKGDVDLDKLQEVIDEYGAGRIPYVCIATAVNMTGGQPISLANLRDVRALCDKHGIHIIHDATRVAENAWFYKVRETECGEMTIARIVRALCDLTDGCTMSAKKGALVNIDGLLALNDEQTFEAARNMCVVFEGLHTYGGMAGRDMEAMAIGLRESVEYVHIRARVGQVEYLGQKLMDWDIPVVRPIGGHAVFLDARAVLEHLDQDEFPAQAMAAEIYLQAGIRAMERGNVSSGRDPRTGGNRRPRLELVRLTIPRRVYTPAHMDVTAEAVAEVYDRRARVKGLEMVFEPQYLRLFQARFRPLD